MKRRGSALLRSQAVFGCITVMAAPACRQELPPAQPADRLIVNARVYSFTWPDPEPDGTPAPSAPWTAGDGWRPDADSVATRGDRVVFVGSAREAERYRVSDTVVIDAQGATVLPGLVDSHVHIAELGAALDRVNLVGVQTEQAAVERVVQWAQRVPKGQWILGWGWDEGAWANRYPDMALLSRRVPDHPVYLKGLHGFAVWGNRLAFERAGISSTTPAPTGGEILKDAAGQPRGILLNTARSLLEDAVPAPDDAQLEAHVLKGLLAMAQAGYVAVHEAGANSRLLAALERLDTAGRLPIRVEAMISARDEPLMRQWIAQGPGKEGSGLLTVRSVKAYYDGALGSRGAALLEDYSDRPGHRGVSGTDYGFDAALVEEAIGAGFQVAIHAIGDAGNRGTLDFLQQVLRARPAAAGLRHRIEHAQVLHPDDIPRLAGLELIASMQPAHAVEDKAWAEERLGAERVRGAYAWRSLRRAGARLIFNSDLPGSDHNIFYGLHAAITRRDRELHPEGGWYPEERLTPEEALRAYTGWAAFAAFREQETGVLAAGRRADITVMDLDPLVLGSTAPEQLLQGKILYTIAGGRFVYRR